MGENTKIEWAHNTFNPWIGCTKVSDGCRNCYAETLMDTRYGRVKWGKGQPRALTSDANWRKPLQWNKQAEKEGLRYRVFCASLADVFDREVEDAWRHRLFALIAKTPHLDWLLLTKRPEVASRFLWEMSWKPWPNVWFGTSVENQDAANTRIPHLLQIPAAVRFLSIEPLLGPIELSDVTKRSDAVVQLGKKAIDGIHWAIVGGESGPHARPMHPAWVRSLRDQCTAARVAFFFKQWGEYGRAYTSDCLSPNGMQWCIGDDPDGRTVMALPDGTITDEQWNGGAGPHLKGAQPLIRVGKKAAGRLLDGRTWDELPPTWPAEQPVTTASLWPDKPPRIPGREFA